MARDYLFLGWGFVWETSLSSFPSFLYFGFITSGTLEFDGF